MLALSAVTIALQNQLTMNENNKKQGQIAKKLFSYVSTKSFQVSNSLKCVLKS